MLSCALPPRRFLPRCAFAQRYRFAAFHAWGAALSDRVGLHPHQAMALNDMLVVASVAKAAFRECSLRNFLVAPPHLQWASILPAGMVGIANHSW